MNPSPNEPKSFFDRKTVMAFLLTGGFFLVWQWFMERNYPAQPPAPVPAAASTAASAPTASAPSAVVAAKPAADKGEITAPTGSVKPEQLTRYDSEQVRFDLSSRGMGIRSIVLKKFLARDGLPVTLGAVETALPFATELVASGQPIDFEITQPEPNRFVGRATIGKTEIVKTMSVDPALYVVDVSVTVRNPDAGFKGVQTTLSDAIVEAKSASFLAPNYEHQDVYFHHDGGKTTRAVLSREKGASASDKNVSLLALSSHYFALAIVDSKTLLPRLETSMPVGGSVATSRLIYEPPAKADAFEVRYKGYAGPKSFETLEQVDPELVKIVDYGMFGFLGRKLWLLLKWCYSIVGNYGVAIILMTLIVRLVVLPFNVYSFRSMKAMQRIQPQINALKERYKDDPRAMNSEVMSLMKTNKANPLGGCLPILLQLPVFFALYQVLGQSIELYRTPFVFWIQDLSMADRFYVLPVLMAGAMFAQQKLTPTPMDPAQAKIMLWMPVVFAFFMLSLPSGLTLYILVSTLFGIAQQLILSRESDKAMVVAAKAQTAK